MTDKRGLIVLGAGGHGRVVADAAEAAGLTVFGYIDPKLPKGSLVNSVPVLGTDELLKDVSFVREHCFVVALGDQKARRALSERLDESGSLRTIMHPSCIVSKSARIGAGSVLAAGAIVNANATIGRFCILNTACSVDHDCVIEDGVQICPGARLSGKVTCGPDALLGAGVTIIPGVTVGASAIVGAGAVVVRNVPPQTVVLGNPARRRK
jgi:sugar O-acyltransferase (sialic acid O-acetyltransferase NeuD family)